MLRSKKDVDRHVRDLLSKVKSEEEVSKWWNAWVTWDPRQEVNNKPLTCCWDPLHVYIRGLPNAFLHLTPSTLVHTYEPINSRTWEQLLSFLYNAAHGVVPRPSLVFISHLPILPFMHILFNSESKPNASWCKLVSVVCLHIQNI